eukprot:CAMPEP_0170616036 /NCGR_PEP_ID=MMETSP0224-20130122/25658_1 /TAXON_ID=285029 /ORGANISM="Togula jolla, Strain CCCM 725" /LENGTH=274 /DNA_ID=CAMNT_0010941811 /DNA_START=6 /DNA_END=830 /DNA_ORIENTATION=+
MQIACGSDGDEIRSAPAAQLTGKAPQTADADTELGALSLPASSIKRIVRCAAPGVRFSGEALAGLHRVAQAYVCFATDRALREVRLDADKAKRSKGRAIPGASRKLCAEHVMRFLTVELPPLASKMATLFPELMPADFKPPGVSLLEQLREQEKVSSMTSFLSEEGGAAAPAGDAAAGDAGVQSLNAEGEAVQPRKRPGSEDLPVVAKKRTKTGGTAEAKEKDKAKESRSNAKEKAPSAPLPLKAPPLQRFFAQRPPVGEDLGREVPAKEHAEP